MDTILLVDLLSGTPVIAEYISPENHIYVQLATYYELGPDWLICPHLRGHISAIFLRQLELGFMVGVGQQNGKSLIH